MFDLQSQISEKMQLMISDGQLESMVQKHLTAKVESVIVEAINNAFAYSSDAKKMLNEAVQKALKFDVENLELPEYRQLILDNIKSEIEARIQTDGIKKLSDAVDKLLEYTAPETISFDDLIEKFINLEILDDANEALEGKISLHIDARDSLTFIRFDAEESKQPYQCQHRLTLYTKDGSIHSYECEGEIKHPLQFGKTHHTFARELFKMYASGTKITDFDLDPDDLKSYSNIG